MKKVLWYSKFGNGSDHSENVDYSAIDYCGFHSRN